MKKALFSLLLVFAIAPAVLAQTAVSRQIVSTDTTVCGTPFAWVNGETFSKDTVATYITADTLYVLNLTYIKTDYRDTPLAIRRSCRYNDWTESGTYTDTVARPNGCDSIYTVVLTIAGTDTIDHPMVACDSATFGDTVFHESIDTNMAVTEDGCTSVYHLQLVINRKVYADTLFVEADCSYTWRNTKITDTLVHSVKVGTAANRCDSIASVKVTAFSNTIHDTLTVSNCGAYSKWNRTFDATGEYDNESVASNCTTATHLILTVKDNTTLDEVVACDSYTWNINGRTYTSSIEVTEDRADTVVGCIMHKTLALTINHSPVVTITGNRSIKPGQSTTLTATPAESNANYAYTWTYNGTTSTQNSIELTNVTENTDVHLLTTNNEGGCQSNNWITVTPYEGAGIDGAYAVAVNIYPNPAARYITIESSEALERVEVFNTLGQKVLQQVMGSSNQIDLGSLVGGNYTLRIVSKEGAIATRKLIISK